MAVGVLAGLHPRKEGRRLQLPQDVGDANRRLHVAALVDVVDGVAVVDHQGDAPVGRHLLGRLHGRRHRVAGGAQPHRVVLERLHHHVDVGGRTQVRVLALEDRAHDRLRLAAAQGTAAAQVVEDQVRRVGAALLHRRLVRGAHDGPRPQALVEAEAGRVLAADGGVRAEGGVVGQALEEEAQAVQLAAVAAQALVQRAPDPTPGATGPGHDVLQVEEAQLAVVQDQSEARHLPVDVLRDVQEGAIPVERRPLQPARQLRHLPGGEPRDLGSQHALHRRQGGPVHRQQIVEDAADPEHLPLSRSSDRSSREAAGRAGPPLLLRSPRIPDIPRPSRRQAGGSDAATCRGARRAVHQDKRAETNTSSPWSHTMRVVEGVDILRPGRIPALTGTASEAPVPEPSGQTPVWWPRRRARHSRAVVYDRLEFTPCPADVVNTTRAVRHTGHQEADHRGDPMTSSHAEQLHRHIEDRSALIGIIGLGYVGLPHGPRLRREGLHGARLRRGPGQGRQARARRDATSSTSTAAGWPQMCDSGLLRRHHGLRPPRRARRHPDLRAHAPDAPARARHDLRAKSAGQ